MSNLRLLPEVGKPWEQQLGEDDMSFALFCGWLLKNPRPSIAGVEHANYYRWSERALAYDNSQRSMGRPKDLSSRSLQNLLRALSIETEHLLQRVLAQPEATNALTPKEIKELMDLVLTHKELVNAGVEGVDHDLSKYSTVEISLLRHAHKLLSGRKS